MNQEYILIISPGHIVSFHLSIASTQRELAALREQTPAGLDVQTPFSGAAAAAGVPPSAEQNFTVRWVFFPIMKNEELYVCVNLTARLYLMRFFHVSHQNKGNDHCAKHVERECSLDINPCRYVLPAKKCCLHSRRCVLTFVIFNFRIIWISYKPNTSKNICISTEKKEGSVWAFFGAMCHIYVLMMLLPVCMSNELFSQGSYYATWKRTLFDSSGTPPPRPPFQLIWSYEWFSLGSAFCTRRALFQHATDEAWHRRTDAASTVEGSYSVALPLLMYKANKAMCMCSVFLAPWTFGRTKI